MAITGRGIGPSAETGEVAVDVIGGLDHQLMKLAFGDEDSRTLVSADNPFPVTDAAIVELLTAISGKLDTLDGRVDGLEGLIGNTNTQLDAANTSLDNIETATTDTNTPVKVESGVFFVDVTLSTDTAAYASGDLIADAQIVAACVRANDATGVLHSVMVLDEDDQGAAFTIYFSNSNASFGTENSAPSITDANARNILGFVDIATSDYKDLGGSRVAFKGGIGMAIKPVASSDDIYVAVVNGSGTPTYTANGLRLRLGFLA